MRGRPDPATIRWAGFAVLAVSLACWAAFIAGLNGALHH